MERDRTAWTDPLTPGQKLVADWEMNPGNEQADLAEMIDAKLQAYWNAGHREGWTDSNAEAVKRLTEERNDYVEDGENMGWHMTNNAMRIVRGIQYEPAVAEFYEEAK
jgi:hypothetical protein